MNGTELQLRVNEIFYSLQGEGFWTGTPAVFVRLSGCNLKCGFCDTSHFRFSLMTPREILKKVTAFPSSHVVLTGGEPTLQPLGELVALLHQAGKYIHIETNGTNPVDPAVDWVTCSPKKNTTLLIGHIDELKVVFHDIDPECYAPLFPRNGNLFLQPCSGGNIPQTVEYILNHPWWRLSLQTHKLIDIP